jgi:hypothetical protein
MLMVGTLQTDRDEWGKDPSVQIMRRVFQEMEKAQHQFLARLNIQPYDLRMRKWRDQALSLFERAWGIASRMEVPIDEQTASAVYVHCLAKIISSEGIKIPAGVLPEAKDVESIVREVFS